MHQRYHTMLTSRVRRLTHQILNYKKLSHYSDCTYSISDKPAPGSPFHLAIPVHDLALARDFYGGILRLKEGRRDENKWQDYSLYGHQIVCHYVGWLVESV